MTNEEKCRAEFEGWQSDIPWNVVFDAVKLLGLEQTLENVMAYRCKMRFMEADAMLKERGE